MTREFIAVPLALFAVLASIAGASAGGIRLNPFGRIGGGETESLWLTSQTVLTPAGSAQFRPLGEGAGTIVSLRDSAARNFFEKNYRQTINLQLSANHRYSAFLDRDRLIVLNLTTGREKFYPPATVFAVDDFGRPALYQSQTHLFFYDDLITAPEDEILRILFFENHPVLFTRSDILRLAKDVQLRSCFRFKGQFFDARIEAGNLYVVERIQEAKRWIFRLYQSQDLQDFMFLEESIRARPLLEMDSHQRIRCPLHYWWNSFNSLVSNSYSQIQEWGAVYLHPGIDLFEAPNTEVYAVKDGIVRIIFTTAADEHWRTAIESLDHPGEGYLYAHLNQNSFVYAAGDTVMAGSVIGTLFPAYSFSPHCHFARIRPCVPGLWNGSWWTEDNPLSDIINMTDTIPPVIENALGSSLFAFRSATGTYLNPLNLSGQIDIIAKCVDYAHAISFDDRIPIHNIGFRIYTPQNPDSAIYSKSSFTLDMPLDTYFGSAFQTLVLNTVYARDATCFSTNNNSARDFYFILTHSDGDASIEPDDSLQFLDTERFEPGPYLLEVVAQDASRNRVSATMPIVIANGMSALPNDESARGSVVEFNAACWPNPFNHFAQIRIGLPTGGPVNLALFDLAGRNLGELFNGWHPAGILQMDFDGQTLPSGVYLYCLSWNGLKATGKMILIK